MYYISIFVPWTLYITSAKPDGLKTRMSRNKKYILIVIVQVQIVIGYIYIAKYCITISL